ncbi:hypothetical protein AGMMS49982_10650 [Bacteroidia bacterium]|nr:hypothetical protein AGMMS49982_10650 [Bacteroidia bacterium]
MKIAMKKIFLMMAVAVLGAASASAQKLSTGFAGGTNTSSFSGDLGDEVKSTGGLQLSAVFDYALNESFSVTPELFVFEGGAKPKNGGGTLTLTYMRLPINATYKFAIKGLNPDSRVLAFAGPYVGYGLLTSEDKPIAFGSGNIFNPWDFGLNIGVGQQIGEAFYKFQYSHGLTNVQYNKDGGNMSFSFTVGHFFY